MISSLPVTRKGLTCTWQFGHSRDCNCGFNWYYRGSSSACIQSHRQLPVHKKPRGGTLESSLARTCSSDPFLPIFLHFSHLSLASFSLPHQLVWHFSAHHFISCFIVTSFTYITFHFWQNHNIGFDANNDPKMTHMFSVAVSVNQDDLSEVKSLEKFSSF